MYYKKKQQKKHPLALKHHIFLSEDTRTHTVAATHTHKQKSGLMFEIK